MRAIITGGSRGIGAACVDIFTKMGWNVVFLYNHSTEKAKALEASTGARALACDISDPSAVAQTLESAVDLLGEIDALINNAGISLFKLLTDISDCEWRRIISIDLDAAFYAMRALCPYMISKKSGAIVNVSSMWGLVGASCESAYSAAKAGLIGLTKAAAKELGPSGIRVNCVCPGVIDTDMNAGLSPDDLASLNEQTPLCRIGKPREVAEAIEFLCSERASFITGQCLSVDGGFAM
ncbi:MAG: SDR family oxidoreductase [Clostridia bacterium]|nr:SDR family oxidoreductase [Clostridia bacterium]